MRHTKLMVLSLALVAAVSGCQRALPVAAPLLPATQAMAAPKATNRLQDSGTVTQVRRDAVAVESAVGDKWYQFAPTVQVAILRKDRQLVPGKLSDLKPGQEIDLWGTGEWQGNRRVITEVWVRYGHPLNP